jgi:hypothetical protein
MVVHVAPFVVFSP